LVFSHCKGGDNIVFKTDFGYDTEGKP